MGYGLPGILFDTLTNHADLPFFVGKTTTSLFVAGIKPGPHQSGVSFFIRLAQKGMLCSDQHQKKVTAAALLEVNQKLETMKSYTSHLSEAAQKNQKKEDARDTISKSGAFGLYAVGFWGVSGFPLDVEFNFFLTALCGHKSFNHEQF